MTYLHPLSSHDSTFPPPTTANSLPTNLGTARLTQGIPPKPILRRILHGKFCGHTLTRRGRTAPGGVQPVHNRQPIRRPLHTLQVQPRNAPVSHSSWPLRRVSGCGRTGNFLGDGEAVLFGGDGVKVEGGGSCVWEVVVPAEANIAGVDIAKVGIAGVEGAVAGWEWVLESHVGERDQQIGVRCGDTGRVV